MSAMAIEAGKTEKRPHNSDRGDRGEGRWAGGGGGARWGDYRVTVSLSAESRPRRRQLLHETSAAVRRQVLESVIPEMVIQVSS